MPQKTVRVTIWSCNRCGHEWQTKNGEKPICCAKCKSSYWDRPRKDK